MAPKAKAAPVVLTRERLLELTDPETVDELLAAAQGEPVETVEMTVDEYERWAETDGTWPGSSD